MIQPLYPELLRRLDGAGVPPAGPAIAYYEADPGDPENAVLVHAGMTVAAGAPPGAPFSVVDLPAVASAAAVVHHGPMDDVLQSLDVVARWIEDHGYRPVGYHREVYLDYHPQDAARGVTELQVAVVKR